MTSGPITSWQIDGETMETVTDYFSGLQNHCRCDCSHEIERCLLLERKAISNLDSILESRDITLLTKVHLVKAVVFPVDMYGYESWTVKKAEESAEELLLLNCGVGEDFSRVPWTAQRSNHSILKEISPYYSLEGLILKLKLQSFGHLMRRTDSFEKTLILGNCKQEEKGMTEDEMVGWPTQWT